MAIMIPSTAYGFDPKSREDEIFSSLEKLPDDYFVFYSFKLASLKGTTWKEKEIDFVVYNQKRGIMLIEAKAGAVWCDHGIWRYGSGIEMKDPFKQADNGRWLFENALKDLQKYDKNPIVNRCKFHFAVWFPSISRKGLKDIVFPQNADESIVLTGEDLDNPLSSIERIFSYDVISDSRQTKLSDEDHKFILNNFLCPVFKILPPKSLELNYKKTKFDAMIVEQSNILNYLEYQRSAVINGAAGTGKTMIAVEKARRHSQNGESVLFLCFNSKLRDYLEKAYPLDGVSYFTIDGFACKMCSTAMPDYSFLENVLFEYDDGKQEFPYKHVIVDEGQDFGQERMHTDTIFELLEDIVLKGEIGSFYVFYDALQTIQAKDVPNFIKNADCKLKLYKNCRNTKRIAETSFRPLKLEKPIKMFESALLGDSPAIAFCDGKEKETLDKVIKKSFVDAMENVQVLSCAPSEQSVLKDYVTDDMYVMKNRKVPFTTVRKFKGLEADHVVLVDVNKESLLKNNMLFYVGSSRAKFQLSIIASLNDDDCAEILSSYGSSVKKNDPKESLAKLLGCKQFQGA